MAPTQDTKYHVTLMTLTMNAVVGQGFTVMRAPSGGSHAVNINRLMCCRHSSSDDEGQHPWRAGVQHITNTQLPVQSQLDDQAQQDDLQSTMSF